MKAISFLVLLATLTSSIKSQSVITPSLEVVTKDFQDQLQADLEDDNINGSISAVIVKGDKIIWSKAFGLSDRVA